MIRIVDRSKRAPADPHIVQFDKDSESIRIHSTPAAATTTAVDRSAATAEVSARAMKLKSLIGGR